MKEFVEEVNRNYLAILFMYRSQIIDKIHEANLSNAEELEKFCEDAFLEHAKEHMADVLSISPKEISDEEVHYAITAHTVSYKDEDGKVYNKFLPLADNELADAHKMFQDFQKMSVEDIIKTFKGEEGLKELQKGIVPEEVVEEPVEEVYEEQAQEMEVPEVSEEVVEEPVEEEVYEEQAQEMEVPEVSEEVVEEPVEEEVYEEQVQEMEVPEASKEVVEEPVEEEVYEEQVQEMEVPEASEEVVEEPVEEEVYEEQVQEMEVPEASKEVVEEPVEEEVYEEQAQEMEVPEVSEEVALDADTPITEEQQGDYSWLESLKNLDEMQNSENLPALDPNALSDMLNDYDTTMNETYDPIQKSL